MSIEVSFLCDWATKVSYLCVWATCNLILHFSGTLLGSARGTWLLPNCGRNLYKFLVSSSFSCSLTLIRCTLRVWFLIRLWTFQTLILRTVLIFARKKRFWKHNSTPLSCVFPTFREIRVGELFMHFVANVFARRIQLYWGHHGAFLWRCYAYLWHCKFRRDYNSIEVITFVGWPSEFGFRAFCLHAGAESEI